MNAQSPCGESSLEESSLKESSLKDSSGELPSGDEELARGLAAGDEACPPVAYRRWSPLVHTLARRSLGAPKEAEDVTQQVLIGVWHGRRGCRPERGTLSGWIVGTTRRKIADALLARGRRFDLAVSAGSRLALAPHTGDRTQATVDGLVVRAELAELPSAQQRVLRLTLRLRCRNCALISGAVPVHPREAGPAITTHKGKISAECTQAALTAHRTRRGQACESKETSHGQRLAHPR